jgi:hypothetical protein
MRWCHRRGQNPTPGRGPGGGEFQKQGRRGPRSENYAFARILSRCQMRIHIQYQAKHCLYNRDVATGTRPCYRPTVKHSMVVAITELECQCCFFYSSCGAGMRYGKKSSEFGVRRGSTAWRARGLGPPMAVTEPRTQYLTILSQPHWHSYSALRGILPL